MRAPAASSSRRTSAITSSATRSGPRWKRRRRVRLAGSQVRASAGTWARSWSMGSGPGASWTDLGVAGGQGRDRAGLDGLALLHEGGLVADGLELLEVVRGDDDGLRAAAATDHRAQVVGVGGVEAGGRLVEQDQLGLAGADADAGLGGEPGEDASEAASSSNTQPSRNASSRTRPSPPRPTPRFCRASWSTRNTTDADIEVRIIRRQLHRVEILHALLVRIRTGAVRELAEWGAAVG
jgi:hypothetical protein